MHVHPIHEYSYLHFHRIYTYACQSPLTTPQEWTSLLCDGITSFGRGQMVTRDKRLCRANTRMQGRERGEMRHCQVDSYDRVGMDSDNSNNFNAALFCAPLRCFCIFARRVSPLSRCLSFVRTLLLTLYADTW